MEYGHPVAPHRDPVFDPNPQRPLYDDPAAGVGSVLEGEEEHHEKTPVLKKVKNKVKKLKDAITKKRHAHDDIHEVYVEEEGEEDMEGELEVYGTPKYQSRNTQLGTTEYTGGVTLGTGGNIPYEHPQSVTLRTGRDFSGSLATGGNIPYEHPQVLGGKIPYEHPEGVPLRTGRDVSGALGDGGTIPYEHQQGVGGNIPQGIPLRTGRDVSGALGAGGTIPYEHQQGVGGNIPQVVPLRTGRDVSGTLGTGGHVQTGRDVSGALRTGGNIPVGGNIPIPSEYPQGVPLPTGISSGQNIPYEHPQGVGRNSLYELSGALGTGRDFSSDQDEHPEGERLTLEAVMVSTLEQDPAAPLPYSSVPLTTGIRTNRPAQAVNTRGNELDVSPNILSSLETMAISDKGDDRHKDQLAQPAMGQVSSDVEKQQPSYTEKLSSTATAAKDAAVSAASTMYSTVAGTQPTGTKMEAMPGREEKGPSYTDKLSSTAAAAKDAALSAASTVYAKVAGKDEGETHDQAATPVSSGPRMVERDREGAGEGKGSYTEKLSETASAAKDAAVSAASTMYSTVAGTQPTGTEMEAMPGREEKGPSYTDKLSSTAAAAKNAALSAASTVYAKVAGKDEGETHDQVATPVSTKPRRVERDREGAGEGKGSYTEKLSETAVAAKDAAVSAASTVYGKVAGAGTAVMEKVQPGGGTEPSLTEYLSEKLRPGDEDRALYEVISETMQERGEEEEVIVEKNRLVLPEVTSQEGLKKIDVVEKERVVWPAVTTREGEMSGDADGGKGIMEKIRETVTSVVGGGGGASDAPPPVAAVETHLGGGRGREPARQEMGY